MAKNQSYMKLQPLTNSQDPGNVEPPRSYDMCMVFNHQRRDYKYGDEGDDDIQKTTRASTKEADDSLKDESKMWKSKREQIVKSLENVGLRVFCYYSRDRDMVLCKIGASAQKLRETAARMKYKLQLKPEYLGAYAEFRMDHPGRPEFNYEDRRVTSHMYQTHGDAQSDEAIFSTQDKILLIHHIITSKDKDCAGIPIGNMLHEASELRGYFPLHEKSKLDKIHAKDLVSFWRLIRMDKEHADRIREYFGDSIAYYFLWCSFYVWWLFPLAIVGLVLQLIDLLCRTPDNLTAVPFCIGMSVWSLWLPHFWRRQEAKYAIGWGNLDLARDLEPVRPEHWGEPRINPVTAQIEPHYAPSKRLKKFVQSSFVLILAVAVVCAELVLLLVVKHFAHTRLMKAGGKYHPVVMSMFVIAIIVECVNYFLGWVASCLTDMENHRTKSEHETHRLIKAMALKFVNAYFVLYYVAFIKRFNLLGNFGVEMHCYRDDCFLDLQSQLAIFVIFRLTFQNLYEVMMPRTTRIMHQGRESRDRLFNFFCNSKAVQMADLSPAETQNAKGKYDSFSDFDEVLITHGYATLFSVTSPWVVSASLVAIAIEIYVDMHVLTTATQRPLPQKARDNEPWSTAFTIYGAMAALTNVSLLVFVSKEYEGAYTFTEKLVLFVVLEHLIIAFRGILKFVLPEVPRSVDLLFLKQNSIVHRCLENIKVEAQTDYSMFREGGGTDFEIFDSDTLDEDEVEIPPFNFAKSREVFFSGLKEAFSGTIKSANAVQKNMGSR